MATPGKITIIGQQSRKALFISGLDNLTGARWYRISNGSSGSSVLGITYTDAKNTGSRSLQLTAGESVDLLAIEIVLRCDAGTDVRCNYEALP